MELDAKPYHRLRASTTIRSHTTSPSFLSLKLCFGFNELDQTFILANDAKNLCNNFDIRFLFTAQKRESYKCFR